MPSITSWTRLEPRARLDGLDGGLQAQVHDPLWLLARQWQLGEFTGEDTGSPVSVRLRAKVAPLATCRPPGGAPEPYRPDRPLEAAVEAEKGEGLAGPRAAVDSGRHWQRLLAAEPGLAPYAGLFVTHCPLTARDTGGLDPDGGRWLALHRRRVPDGALLAPVLTALARGTVPAWLPASPAHVPVLSRLASSWLAHVATCWPGGEGPGGGSAEAADYWRPERMEYRFTLTAPGAELTAPEYDGARLDWYSFDLDPAPGEGGAVVTTSLPAPASFAGAPAPRWWEFEDARVDLGSLTAESRDLARLLLVEYAVVYGNDWYLMPLRAPVGSVVRVDSLVVTDSFGRRTLVRAAGDLPGDGQDWSLFRHSGSGGGRADRLLVSPTLPASLQGEPLEVVRLFRDEGANLAWALEESVEGAAGRRVHRAQEPAAVPEPVPGRYRLASSVPAHWFPLIPQAPRGGGQQLRRGTVPSPTGGPDPVPLGTLLTPGADLLLHEEEVPRDGAEITRAWQYARWSDGSTHTWIGRRKRPGLGEGSSGLVFDTVD
ncbi:hypothetical protein [Streptomyces sp. NPDC056144]|uniref:hypothetical protein n=1 Tax=unclassified Streptomyces TaxID=2593676 RepID=UPI0035DA3400